MVRSSLAMMTVALATTACGSASEALGRAAMQRASTDLTCTELDYEAIGAGGVVVHGCGRQLTYTCISTARGPIVCTPEGQARGYVAPPALPADPRGIVPAVASCDLSPGSEILVVIGVEGDLLRFEVVGATPAQQACARDAVASLHIPGGSDATSITVTTPSVAAPPPTPSDVEPRVRALIDGARAGIVACMGGPTAVVGEWAADGSLSVHLPAGRAGSAEDGCVRAAAQGLRVDPAPGASGSVLHAVQ